MSKEITIEKELRRRMPTGHPDFIPICLKMMELHSEKNQDYAKGGDPLGNFDRVSKIFSLYPNLRLSNPVVVAFAYMMKQIDAILWMINMDYEGGIEDTDSRFGDVNVYSILARIIHRQKKRKK